MHQNRGAGKGQKLASSTVSGKGSGKVIGTAGSGSSDCSGIETRNNKRLDE